MKVKDLILEITGIEMECSSDGKNSAMTIPITESLKEALEREVIVKSDFLEADRSINDIRYDGYSNIVIIELD